MQNISQCVKAVKEIETSTLVSIGHPDRTKMGDPNTYVTSSSPSKPSANANSLKASKNCETHDPVISESARRSTSITGFQTTTHLLQVVHRR
jgi:hypothetical protein